MYASTLVPLIMSHVPNKLSTLKDRAAMLRAARDFFYTRGVTEVDCPLISPRASVDAHIDLISADDNRFLHSSPEYGMKRLLAEGMGDIFQLSHVFRKGEVGKKHNPEFMMAEWYRLGITFQEMVDETVEFIKLFIGEWPCVQMTYREMFLNYSGIDIATTTEASLKAYCEKEKIKLYADIDSEGLDAFLNIILGKKIEPQLGNDDIFMVTHYPATQAALAQKSVTDNFEVAERFEIYHKGLELANGYHELADAEEQLQRLLDANIHRQVLGKNPLPIDKYFIEAIKKGLPDCCGVAVGVDRCMMLRHATDTITDVTPFGWNNA